MLKQCIILSHIACGAREREHNSYYIGFESEQCRGKRKKERVKIMCR